MNEIKITKCNDCSECFDERYYSPDPYEYDGCTKCKMKMNKHGNPKIISYDWKDDGDIPIPSWCPKLNGKK